MEPETSDAGLIAPYTFTYDEGFLLTEGLVSTRDKSSRSILVPVLQLMKVNIGHPVQLIYAGGNILLKPFGDERTIGEIQRDRNGSIYDGISIFLYPSGHPYSDNTEGLDVREGFTLYDGGGKQDLKIRYIEGREYALGCEGIETVVDIPTPIIPKRIAQCFRQEPAMYTLLGDKRQPIARISLDERNLLSTARSITETLEKRFQTRMNV